MPENTAPCVDYSPAATQAGNLIGLLYYGWRGWSWTVSEMVVHAAEPELLASGHTGEDRQFAANQMAAVMVEYSP